MDEVGTEPSSDADSDLFGLDWGDDPIATINSVTERNDRTRGGKELLAFVYVPSTLWRRFPSRRAELVVKELTDHTSSTMGSDGFESRQALESK